MLTRTYTVFTHNDTTPEGDETMNVTLSNATNGATIDDGAGVGTIIDNDVPHNTAQIITNSNVEGQALQVTLSSSSGRVTTGSVTLTDDQGQEVNDLTFGSPILFTPGSEFTVALEHVGGNTSVILIELNIFDSNGQGIKIYDANAKINANDSGNNTNPDGLLFNVTIDAGGVTGESSGFTVSPAIGYEVLGDILTLDTETQTDSFTLDFSSLPLSGSGDLFGHVDTVDITGNKGEDNSVTLSAQDVLDLGGPGDIHLAITGDSGDALSLTPSGDGAWSASGEVANTYIYDNGSVIASVLVDNDINVVLV